MQPHTQLPEWIEFWFFVHSLLLLSITFTDVLRICCVRAAARKRARYSTQAPLRHVDTTDWQVFLLPSTLKRNATHYCGSTIRCLACSHVYVSYTHNHYFISLFLSIACYPSVADVLRICGVRAAAGKRAGHSRQAPLWQVDKTDWRAFLLPLALKRNATHYCGSTIRCLACSHAYVSYTRHHCYLLLFFIHSLLSASFCQCTQDVWCVCAAARKRARHSTANGQSFVWSVGYFLECKTVMAPLRTALLYKTVSLSLSLRTEGGATALSDYIHIYIYVYMHTPKNKEQNQNRNKSLSVVPKTKTIFTCICTLLV